MIKTLCICLVWKVGKLLFTWGIAREFRVSLKSPFSGSHQAKFIIPILQPHAIRNIFIGNDKAKNLCSVFELNDLPAKIRPNREFHTLILMTKLYWHAYILRLTLFDALILKIWLFNSGVVTGIVKSFIWHDLTIFVFIWCIILVLLLNRWTLLLCNSVNKLLRSYSILFRLFCWIVN